MELQYNGISLRALKTDEIVREAVRSPDNGDYLYTRWVIGGTFLYNGGLNSYRPAAISNVANFDPPPPADVAKVFYDPIRQNGPSPTPPRLTDVAIRHQLMQQGKPLRLVYASTLYDTTDEQSYFGTTGNGADVLLQSPLPVHGGGLNGPAYGLDAKGGPFPLDFRVVAQHGFVTWVVYYRIETYVNECGQPLSTGARTPPVVLSNRFSMTHDADEEGMLTSKVDGEAVFRRDVLEETFEGNPDEDFFRKFVFLPILSGFKRSAVRVEQLPDRSGVRYSYVDRQMAINFPNRAQATRIEATFDQQIGNDQDITMSVAETLSRFLNDAFAAQRTVGDVTDPLEEAAKGVFTGGASAILGAGKIAASLVKGYLPLGIAVARGVQSIFPQYTGQANVRVWGTKTSTKQRLYQLALSVAFGQFTGLFDLQTALFQQQVNRGLAMIPNPFTLKTRYDVYGKYVEVTLVRSFSATPFGFFGLSSGWRVMANGPPTEEVYGGVPQLPMIPPALLTVVAGVVSQGLSAIPGMVPVVGQFFGSAYTNAINQNLSDLYSFTTGWRLPDTNVLVGTDRLTPWGNSALNPMPNYDLVSSWNPYYATEGMPTQGGDVSACGPIPDLGSAVPNVAINDPFFTTSNVVPPPGVADAVPQSAWLYDGLRLGDLFNNRRTDEPTRDIVQPPAPLPPGNPPPRR